MKTARAMAQKIAHECPGMRARQAARLLSRAYDEALRPLDIQISQLSVLVAVAMFGEDGAAVGALADALVMDRTTITRNIRPLEKSGWLRVARSPSDARARLVLLTAAGERVIESAYPLWEAAQRRVRASFGAGRLDLLRKQLSDVVDLAERL